jgi:general secretion pathway protein A
MYTRFFGFKERPFKLVPNPAYLYLSKGHEEALAHLQCAVVHEDGFVAITGEVGTGKTTLCRSFLENLGKEVEAAYIFNPRLDAVGLLKAINEEFGIEHTADAIKPLIDTLNQYLMAQHAQGKKVLLIIDEAQNLGRDVLEQLRLLSNLETTLHKLLQIVLVGQPELGELLDSHALRQLRQRITLYARLTPFTLKETREYIEHRIRIASGRSAVRFTRSACRRIHRFAGGTPRLINIACDRALLCAFGVESRKVTRRIVGEALDELGYSRRQPRAFPVAIGAVLGSAVICVLTVVALWPRLPVFSAFSPVDSVRQKAEPEKIAADVRAGQNETGKQSVAQEPEKITADVRAGDNETDKQSVAQEPEKIAADVRAGQNETGKQSVAQEPEKIAADVHAGDNETDEQSVAQEPEKIAAAGPVLSAVPPPQPLVEETTPAIDDVPAMTGWSEFVTNMSRQTDATSLRQAAAHILLTRWLTEDSIKAVAEPALDDETYFRLAAGRNQLEVLTLKNDLAVIERLNLPAILELDVPDGERDRKVAGFAVLEKIADGAAFLASGTAAAVYRVPVADLRAGFRGKAFVFWKNFWNLQGTISASAPPQTVLLLKMYLKELGFPEIDPAPAYDAHTRSIISRLQARHGLSDDGLVGSQTKIVLYNDNKSLGLPFLNHQR